MATKAAILVGLLICIAGGAYAVLRPDNYASQASMVLVPTAQEPDDLTSLFDGFDQSGTMGTVVELISSRDTLAAAGSPPVTLTVRAVPDTRVIQIEARGAREAVQPGLTAVLTSAPSRLERLRDLWELQVLAAPNAATAVPPSLPLIILGTLLTAALGALATWVSMSKLALGRQPQSRAEVATAVGAGRDPEPLSMAPASERMQRSTPSPDA